MERRQQTQNCGLCRGIHIVLPLGSWSLVHSAPLCGDSIVLQDVATNSADMIRTEFELFALLADLLCYDC
jgi:hypothetical protein